MRSRSCAVSSLVALLAGATAPAQGPVYDVTWARASTFLAGYSQSNGSLAAWSQGTALPGGSWGIGVDGQMNVWSSDYTPGSNTVTRCDASGAWIGAYPAGPTAGPAEATVGPLAIDRLGFVYVGDPRFSAAQGTVTKLDPQGAIVATLPIRGRGLNCLVIDPNGDFWVIVYGPNAGHGPIQKYSATGSFLLSTATGGTYPNILYADEWGRIAATHHPISSAITLFNLGGAVISSFYGPYSGSVAVGLDGSLWWVGGWNASKYSSGGTQLIPTITHSGVSLTGIAFDASGAVWFSGRNSANGSCRLIKHLRDGPLAFAIDIGPTNQTFNIGDMTGLLRARTIDPTGDMDGDGFTNYAEVVGQSSPLNPGSVPGPLALSTPPVIGTQIQIGIFATFEANSPYFFPFSTNPAPFPLQSLSAQDPRSFPISFTDPLNPTALDPVWTISVGPSPFTALIFPDTFGVLDASGLAFVRVNIPPIPALIGMQIHGAFCTLSAQSPSGVRTISPRLTVIFQ